MKRIVIATGNSGKLREICSLLSPLHIEVVAQSTLSIESAEETGLTFIENALLKARHAAALSGLPALADDSGLVVDALNGNPGIRSARYAGEQADDAANVDKLLAALDGTPEAERTARFHCVVTLLRHPDDATPLLCQGVWEGHVAEKRRGAGGFGYDPVFVDCEHGISAAEMSPEQKNRLSHRGKALRAMHAALAALSDAGFSRLSGS